jgi:Tfp pilus assembly protein PilV
MHCKPTTVMILPRVPRCSQEYCGWFLRKNTAEAFTLIEVVIALGLFIFAVTAIIGLFSVGIGTSKESSDQIQAANFASLLISTRRAIPVDPANATIALTNFALPSLNAATPAIGTNVLNVMSDGTKAAAGAGDYNLRYQVTLDNTATPATPPRLAQVHLTIWWPTASATPPADPSKRYELTTQVALPAPASP